MVLSTAAKAARAAARRAASKVKTGPRGGQTRSDRIVERSSARSQRIVNKKLKSDQRASLAGQRHNTRGGGPNWRTGSADKGYEDNILHRGMGLTRAEGLREARKAAAIEKARRAKADGRMYFGLGAAGVAGTGFFGQQAYAAGPTHLEHMKTIKQQITRRHHVNKNMFGNQQTGGYYDPTGYISIHDQDLKHKGLPGKKGYNINIK